MPWKVVSILWPQIAKALLPLDLAKVIARLPRLLARLAALDHDGDYRADNDRSRPRQVDNFRSRFASEIRSVA
jgi:hypothetical protein